MSDGREEREQQQKRRELEEKENRAIWNDQTWIDHDHPEEWEQDFRSEPS